uniref:Uncharacterized protein n=1 Tax=Solanum tuberosum TaxID=4113 RepID=M1DH17_SOLTU
MILLASISKEDSDDIKSYEKVSKNEMIFLLENSEIQRKEEPWKIFQRKISVQDGDKEAMINSYLEEVKRSLLLNITQYEKSDTSMRSETSEDANDIQEAQPVEATIEDTLKKAENFLRKLKEKDNL